MKLSIVIAAYDEVENVEELTRRLDAVLRRLVGVAWEMIFVVEGRDGTREVLERLAEELGRIRVAYHELPSGLGAAFRRGFALIAPDTDVVATMDADLNHHPEELPRLLAERERLGADILIGSRLVRGARADGIPLWKRGASGIVNRIIGTLFNVEAVDKSSGFRVYRADALRRLTAYRNDDFAFLPEMLIQATTLGMAIFEVPIHFTFRTRGRSKMSIAQTSRSYLTLLRSRFDRLSVAALALLVIGLCIRIASAFPVHKFVPDADSLLSGLRALDILSGRLTEPASYSSRAALESYMHVPAIWLFGVTRGAISVAPLVSSVATLLVVFFFMREIAGRRTAVIALLFLALPSPAYLAWTYRPNGYAETILLCASALYFAARTARTGERDWSTIAFALSVGLGIWQSPQTLACAIPALVWLCWERAELLRRRRFLTLFAAGVLVGAAPWIVAHAAFLAKGVGRDFSLRSAYGALANPADGVDRAAHALRELLVGSLPPHGMLGSHPPTALESILAAPAAAVYGLALLLLPISFGKGARGSRPSSLLSRRGATLLILVAVAVIADASFFHSQHPETAFVGSVLPFFLVAAAALGSLVAALWQRGRWLAVAVTLLLLIFDGAAYPWPWTVYRCSLRDLDQRDHILVAFLEANRVRWVGGAYDVVYPITFDSGGRISGIPVQRAADHFDYALRFRDTRSTWALVATSPATLARWVHRTPVLAGHVTRVAKRYSVFLPSERESPRWTDNALIRALRDTAHPADRERLGAQRDLPRATSHAAPVRNATP